MKRIRSRIGTLSLLLAAMGAVLSGNPGCGSGDGTSSETGQSGGDPALVGTWIGHEMTDPSTVWSFVMDDNTMKVASSGVEAYAGTYTADPASNPKRLTARITSCPYAAYVGKTSNAIYQIDGATLSFAGNEPGNPAVPTSFTPGSTRVFNLNKE